MRYQRLVEGLNKKAQQNTNFRRYNLSEIISESYKMIYNSKADSNLQKLAEAHLEDVRNNPTDTDRLSRQLCNLKYLSRMIESKKMKDEELLVPEEKYSKVIPDEKEDKDLKESIHDEDVEETEDEDLLEDSDLTDEELEELTKHLAELRKNKKSVTEDKKTTGCIGAKVGDIIVDTKTGKEGEVKREGQSGNYGLIYVDFGNGLRKINPMDDAQTTGRYQLKECDASKKSVEESTKPRKLKRANEAAPTWSRYHIVDPDGEIIDSYTDRKDAEEWIKQLYKDGDYKKGELKVVDSQEKKSTKSYESLNLSDFSKKSASKAFVKTFKKLDGKLREGTALTRQESIALYKAANSAMTHLSVELEHNPEFLSTFSECTTLLSTDISKLLESMKKDKAPSKATMKSLAKFSESLLREEEEIEDDIPVEDEEDSVSEESEEFDQEYADARVEIHKELADEHADTEDPEVQEKLAQDAEEVASLPGTTEEQAAELLGEEVPEESAEEGELAEPEMEESIHDEDVESKDDKDLLEDDDSEITDEELEALKKHLTEMRQAKKVRESTKARKLKRHS